ncbi:uncharacterized protein J3D65DRAFT_343246 [Phyllosticta citribraziliensis]|uniref:Uncharacterized protein n=1 Tax=Phyllosticta citribraziliensis TaxID=989973 RepID=A0ABR1LW65_9PEZI
MFAWIESYLWGCGRPSSAPASLCCITIPQPYGPTYLHLMHVFVYVTDEPSSAFAWSKQEGNRAEQSKATIQPISRPPRHADKTRKSPHASGSSSSSSKNAFIPPTPKKQVTNRSTASPLRSINQSISRVGARKRQSSLLLLADLTADRKTACVRACVRPCPDLPGRPSCISLPYPARLFPPCFRTELARERMTGVQCRHDSKKAPTNRRGGRREGSEEVVGV